VPKVVTVSFANGLATYSRIVPGEYSLSVGREGAGRASVETEVRAGRNTIDLQPRRGRAGSSYPSAASFRKRSGDGIGSSGYPRTTCRLHIVST